MNICGKQVGNGQPCFVIAEAGVNHNGSLELACQLVDAAVRAGADAVKFQTFSADRLVTRDAPKADYQKRSAQKTDAQSTNESQWAMLRRLELSATDHRTLVTHCQQSGIEFLSTPFDEEAATLLAELGVSAFKIPSGEVTNLPFLRHIAQFGKPLIMSTGMCHLAEVEAAVEVIEAAGCRDLVLLHCVSNYPADPADVNLRAMQTLAAAFGWPVGYSDHTLGNEVSLAAIALGASVLEKHFTLDRSLPGPDHAASLEPIELQSLIRGVRTVESALGTGRKRPATSEQNTASVARKSLVAAVDLEPGQRLTPDVIVLRRPGTGLPPTMQPHLVNRVVRQRIIAGSLIRLEDVA